MKEGEQVSETDQEPGVGPAMSVDWAGQEGRVLGVMDGLLSSIEMGPRWLVLGTLGRKGLGTWFVSGHGRDGCGGSGLQVGVVRMGIVLQEAPWRLHSRAGALRLGRGTL